MNGIIEDEAEVDQLDLSVQVIGLAPGPAGVGTLDKRPDAVYIVTAESKNSVRVAIIKSDGKELYSSDYPKEWLKFYDI